MMKSWQPQAEPYSKVHTPTVFIQEKPHTRPHSPSRRSCRTGVLVLPCREGDRGSGLSAVTAWREAGSPVDSRVCHRHLTLTTQDKRKPHCAVQNRNGMALENRPHLGPRFFLQAWQPGGAPVTPPPGRGLPLRGPVRGGEGWGSRPLPRHESNSFSPSFLQGPAAPEHIECIGS